MNERVDQDRLADYVGGALDGTPDAAAVRTLIETDAGWAAAHADLVAAMDAVSANLRAVGSRPHPVPEDVAARLDGFLRRLESDREPAGAARTATGGSGPTAAGDVRADGTRSDASRGPGGSSRPGGAGPGRRAHSRRARWAAGLSAAAAVIAVGIGAIAMVPTMNSDDSSTGGAADSAAGGAAAPQVAAAGPPVVSGRDYAPGSFTGLGSGQRAGVQGVPEPPAGDTPRENSEDQSKTFSSAGSEGSAAVPPELTRLQGADARQDCLDAIRQAHGGTPRVVEFARFTGRPALVVLLDGASTGNGRPWVVVAGPDCGLTPGDADELYNGPLS